MNSEIFFEVNASNIDQTYGVSVIVSDTPLDADLDKELPYYFLVFKGPDTEVHSNEVSKHFMAAHEEAMTSVGLEGHVDEDKFEALLEDSIELAGELMIRHGFNVLDVKDVDENLVKDLFEKVSFDEEEESSTLTEVRRGKPPLLN